MSPVVLTTPLDRVGGTSAPAPVSPVDAPALAAAAASPVAATSSSAPAPSGPVVPRAGEPRFSVPGLEHVVVEGTEPEPTGPVGYRTPARFAHQQAVAAPAPAPAPAFDAVLAPPPATATATRQLPTQPQAEVPAPAHVEPSLPADAAAAAVPRRRVLGATPGALLGAVAALATLGLAAWWFTSPATVHVIGLALGAISLVCSIATLRDRAATWQRSVALLGAVLGTVGTLALLWAVASAALPMAGVTLPDLTGSGAVPTLAP